MEFPVELPVDILDKARHLHVEAADIDEQFVRGSGAGGQKINKTNSCVWLKHLPTGVEVKCQDFREREVNRKRAYKLLVLKIEMKVLGKKSEIAQKLFKIRKQKKRRTRKAKERMMEGKSRRGELKANRKRVL